MEERLQRLREHFLAARELSVERRKQFLDIFCPDPEERAEVERMLDADARESLLLNRTTPMFSPPSGARTQALEPENQFHSGQVVAGRYEVIRFLGRGGMGEVYEVQDADLHVRVALKTARVEAHTDGRLVARFLQEIQLARKVAHHNVCRVFDVARHVEGESQILLLTMEYLDGETLSARLRRTQGFPLKEALSLARQMAEGLTAAHRADVVHRDFKSSNVMLVEEPQGGTRAVITDFGLARSMLPAAENEVTLTGTGHLLGTPDYMAPEQLMGEEATKASDVYAFGIVLYELVTGVRPFSESRSLSAAYRRLHEKVPSPRAIRSDLPREWERCILGCLQADPAERFATAADAVRELTPNQSGITLPSVRLLRTPRKRRRAAWIAAAVMAIGLAGAWFAIRRTPSPSNSAEALAAYAKGSDLIEAGSSSAATRLLQQAVDADPHFRMAHARLADALLDIDDLSRAQREIIIANTDSTSGPLSRDDQLFVDGISFLLYADYLHALASFKRRTESGSVNDRLTRRYDLGRALMRSDEFAKAQQVFESLTGEMSLRPGPWLAAGRAHSYLAQTAPSRTAFARAEKIFTDEANAEGLTEVKYARGMAEMRFGNAAEARSALEQAIQQTTITGNLLQRARCLLGLSGVELFANRPIEAEKRAQEAEALARREHFAQQDAMALIRQAEARSMMSDSRKEEELLRQASAVAMTNNDRYNESAAQFRLAFYYLSQGKLDQVDEPANRALAYFRERHMHAEINGCLLTLGRAQRTRQDFVGAEKTAQALRDPENMRTPIAQAQAQEFSGSLLSTMERYPEALGFFKDVPGQPPSLTAYTALHQASTFWRLGRFSESDKAFARALTLASQNRDLQETIAREMAESKFSQLRFAEALKDVSVAHEFADRSDIQDLSELSFLTARAHVGLKRARARTDIESAWQKLPAERRARYLRALTMARWQSGDAQGVMRAAQEAGDQLNAFPETKWWNEALAAQAAASLGLRADAERFASSATAARAKLEQTFGANAFATYLTRPDVQHFLLAPSRTNLRQ